MRDFSYFTQDYETVAEETSLLSSVASLAMNGARSRQERGVFERSAPTVEVQCLYSYRNDFPRLIQH